ncbi:hypothetical protein C1646_758914, partial [Rhizophagus diaphanus]
MSANTSKDSNHYIDWLERSIADEHIKYYEYSDFKNIRPLGNGSYGKVNCANWKNTEHFFALKSFSNDKQTLEEIIKEKPANPTQQTKNYLLVLEYANSGTLNTYLDKNFNDLDWDDKSRLALQLADAVGFLHDNDIVHRDLHSGNILIHQNSIKLTDFGLSKKVTETSSVTSKIQGVMPYVDPKKLNDENYKLNKKSDVYSIGVLLWQISSGHEPFEGIERDVSLSLSLIEGTREKIIDGTPINYSKLYTECWKYESNERPNIHEVILTLKEIISPEKIDDMTVDINDDLDINNSLILSTISHIVSLENSNIYESRLSSQNCIDVVEFDNTSSSNKSDTLDQISVDMNETISVAMAKELIDYIITKHDSGITLDDQIQLLIIKKILQSDKNFNNLSDTLDQQLLIKRILQSNQNFNNLMDWLSSNKDVSIYGWLLGLFYYYNIGVDEKEDYSIESFELFSKAANNNYLIAQVYLAKCYYDGYGTTLDHILAHKYYQESAKNGSIIGQFYLGNFYESVNNEKDSVYWYKKAAKSGNTIAKLHLANCYRLGKGTEKDGIKAFQYYEALANKEIADAQLKLGDCFYNGIGTKLDITQAKYWYEKAANNGSIIAKNNLEDYYNEKIRFGIDKHKKIKFYYKTLFSTKRIIQIGLYRFSKILLKTNYEKSVCYLQKAAENGCKFAQFNLGGCYQLGHGVRKDIRKAFELYKRSAEQEYINAQSQLIYYYGYGLGTEINRVKAFELVKIIADKGFKHAQYLLGLHYRTGEGVDKDEIKAFNLFEKLVNESTKCLSNNSEINKQKDFEYFKISMKYMNSNSLYQLGYCYDKGVGTELNLTKAFELYKIAAEKGHNVAQNVLGNSYENGTRIEKDLKQAFYWYNKAADNGYYKAQYNLGRCYQNGIGVEKDEKKAFEYYMKSAEQGCLCAQFKLGYCYDIGFGAEINKTKAFELYKEVAEKGYSMAQNYLGSLYENGKGTKKDLKQAVYWYKKAAGNGNEMAQYNLDRYYQNKSKEFKKSTEQEYINVQFKLGYCYFNIITNKTKTNHGNKLAQYNLGRCYRFEKGIEKNERKAFEYYKKSSEQGYLNAQFKLGYCYSKGIGTEINKTKAFELYKVAAERGY